MLASHTRECTSGGLTSTYDQLINDLVCRCTSSRPVGVITFSPDQELALKKRTETQYPQIRYLRLDGKGFNVNPNSVLVFSSLGKVVHGSYSYGLALCNYGINVYCLPTAPKTRYDRILESQPL